MNGTVLERSNHAEAGFSLVEVLVSLFLVSVMAASLAAMTGQFRQIAHSTNRNLELSALQAAVRHIARQVEQAEALPLGETEQNTGFLFGGANDLQFVALVRLGSTEQSLRTIKIDLRAGHGVVQANRMRRLGESAVSELLILDDVQSLDFSYLGRDAATGSSIWRQSWDSVDQLPFAVSVTLTKLDKTKRPMTSTSVAWLTPL